MNEPMQDTDTFAVRSVADVGSIYFHRHDVHTQWRITYCFFDPLKLSMAMPWLAANGQLEARLMFRPEFETIVYPSPEDGVKAIARLLTN